jgi:hypothetical protein
MYSTRRWMRAVAVAGVAISAASAAWGGGPRFITGTSGYTTAGMPMAWYTNAPLYFTDAGDLSSTVTHAQADAMVAAAAAVWNIPTASVVLAKGGELAEHVVGNGTYAGTDIVFPADVEAGNYQNVQIPVIYDSDGSVIEMLLGSGASGSSECRENGVVESVDQFGSSGTIQHAVIILNGLCAGSAPEQLTQMQYQLTRMFGRVLGLAWSQLNDNVFTGASQVTAAQMAVWPLMHPIDVICGPYTYQCMQGAFTLRPDDIHALVTLYPVATSGGGKTQSALNTVSVSGTVNFPTAQGMELANVVAYRQIWGQDGGWEAYPVYSSTVGFAFQQNAGNPVSGAEAANENAGASAVADEGAWSMPYMMAGPSGAYLYFRTESINPLYSGENAAGAYQRPVIALSGANEATGAISVVPGTPGTMAIGEGGGAQNWCQYPDSLETNPPASSSTGWWNGSICSVAYPASWRKTVVNANTSWTIEVAALNEAGTGTVQKMQPVIGVWNATDATGTLPTVASEPAAMNALVLGMTQLRVTAAASAATYRMVIADRFGAGRPDFNYTARVLYASGVSPVTLGSAGGQITINGMGFQKGNRVLVNGVAAVVSNWTSTQIVATAPTMAMAGASSGTAVDVEVLDASTAGSTDIGAALMYNAGTKDLIALLTVPTSLETGITAPTLFKVQVYKPDGVTAAVGATVAFVVSSSGAGAAFAMGCVGGAQGCVVTTSAAGQAAVSLTGVAAGSVTVKGTEMSGGASVAVTIADANPVQTVTIGATTQYLAAGAAGSWSLSLTAMQDGVAANGLAVAWSSAASGFVVAPLTGVTGANGSTPAVVAQVAGIASGSTNVVSGCAWTNVCATWTVYGVAASQWVIGVSSAGGQNVARGVTPAVVKLLVTDGAGHALPGAGVNVYQTAYAWEGPCAVKGSCAPAPVLMKAKSTAVSDANGMVSVTPIEVPGVAQVVKIAAATGTRGFVTTWVEVGP